MRAMLSTLVLMLILTAAAADARMYQWTSPDSGNVQLSGHPPAWYRGSGHGPRVLVFEDGELIDDTAIAVSEAQRVALRARAFGAQSAAAAARARDDGRSALREAMEQAHEAGVDVGSVSEEFAAEQQARAQSQAQAPPEADVEAKVDALKSLIEAWDERRVGEARALLDVLPEDSEPAPQPQPR